MRILVNDIAASNGGALSILKSFYDYVVKFDKENEYIFLLGDNYLTENCNVKIRVFPEIKKSRIKRLMFDFYGGKAIVKEMAPDVILSLQNTMIFGVSEIPQIVYMHQSIPFQSKKSFSLFKKNERNLAIVQHLIGKVIMKSVKKADYVIVQTKWIKEAVVEKTGIDHQRIVDVFPKYEMCEEIEKTEFDNTLFFYPASKELYKNHACIYSAVELLKKKGIKDFSVILTLDGNDTEHIKYIGQIPREEVLQYLQQGTLVFPSYIETVGLPMLESRSVGGMVLASNCAFSHEVLEGYENAYFFDPFNANELAEFMEMIITERIVKTSVDSRKIEKLRQGWRPVCELIDKVGERLNKIRLMG